MTSSLSESTRLLEADPPPTDEFVSSFGAKDLASLPLHIRQRILDHEPTADILFWDQPDPEIVANSFPSVSYCKQMVLTPCCVLPLLGGVVGAFAYALQGFRYCQQADIFRGQHQYLVLTRKNVYHVLSEHKQGCCHPEEPGWCKTIPEKLSLIPLSKIVDVGYTVWQNRDGSVVEEHYVSLFDPYRPKQFNHASCANSCNAEVLRAMDAVYVKQDGWEQVRSSKLTGDALSISPLAEITPLTIRERGGILIDGIKNPSAVANAIWQAARLEYTANPDRFVVAIQPAPAPPVPVAHFPVQKERRLQSNLQAYPAYGAINNSVFTPDPAVSSSLKFKKQVSVTWKGQRSVFPLERTWDQFEQDVRVCFSLPHSCALTFVLEGHQTVIDSSEYLRNNDSLLLVNIQSTAPSAQPSSTLSQQQEEIAQPNTTIQLQRFVDNLVAASATNQLLQDKNVQRPRRLQALVQILTSLGENPRFRTFYAHSVLFSTLASSLTQMDEEEQLIFLEAISLFCGELGVAEEEQFSADFSQVRQAMIRAGYVELIAQFILQGPIQLADPSAVILMKLCRERGADVQSKFAKLNVLPRLCSLLGQAQSKVNFMRGINALITDHPQNVRVAVEAGFISYCVEILGSSDNDEQSLAALNLAMLVSTENCRVLMIQSGVVTALIQQIGTASNHPRAQSNACCVLGKLASDPQALHQMRQDNRLFPSLSQLLSASLEETRANAAGCLAAIASQGDEHCLAIAQAGIVPSLIALSQSRSTAKDNALAVLSMLRGVPGLEYQQLKSVQL